MDVKTRESERDMDVKAKGSGGGRRSRSSSTGSGTAATLDRKEIERRRRQHMKGLCTKLASLIPQEHYSSKDTMTQLGSLDEAAAYIKKLRERVDELQQKRSSAQLMASLRGGGGVSTPTTTTTSGGAGSESEGEEATTAPVVEVRYHDDSSLDVALICSAASPFKLYEVITILDEEGAEILNANYSVAGNKIFYTIHARVFSSRIGIEVSRVSERLRALV